MHPELISTTIRARLGSYDPVVDVAEVEQVISIGDGIARVSGVESAMLGEMLEFPGGLFGIALNLEEERVGVVLLGVSRHIKEGDLVRRTGRIISVRHPSDGEQRRARPYTTCVHSSTRGSPGGVSCSAHGT
jgi:F-type H+-transporting ATPase subunit alpha